MNVQRVIGLFDSILIISVVFLRQFLWPIMIYELEHKLNTLSPTLISPTQFETFLLMEKITENVDNGRTITYFLLGRENIYLHMITCLIKSH